MMNNIDCLGKRYSGKPEECEGCEEADFCKRATRKYVEQLEATLKTNMGVLNAYSGRITELEDKIHKAFFELETGGEFGRVKAMDILGSVVE